MPSGCRCDSEKPLKPAATGAASSAGGAQCGYKRNLGDKKKKTAALGKIESPFDSNAIKLDKQASFTCIAPSGRLPPRHSGIHPDHFPFPTRVVAHGARPKISRFCVQESLFIGMGYKRSKTRDWRAGRPGIEEVLRWCFGR